MTGQGEGTRGEFARFLLVGALSVGVDTGSLVLLHEAGRAAAGRCRPHWPSRITLVVNFSLNMGFVFGVRGRLAGRLVRYGALVVANYVLTLLLVLGIAALGVNYVVAKLVAVAVCALVNFVAYRHWVFV